MSDLKPCPFCGSSAEINRPLLWFARCTNCGAHGPLAGSEDEAIEKWNEAPRWDEVMELPRDADGVPIRPGDVLYGLAHTPAKPFQDMSIKEMVIAKDGKWRVNGRCTDRGLLTITERWYTHVKPDTWESVEADIYHLVMAEYLEDPEADVKAIMERIKKLKEGE